jgi:hypothetical protein
MKRKEKKKAKEAFFFLWNRKGLIPLYLLAVLVVMALKVQVVDKDRDGAVVECQFGLDVASS